MDYRDIKEPFAVNGDREQIDYAPTSQEISWLNGYTYLYGLKPDETSLSPYIEREKFNEIFYLTTAKMLDIEKYAQNIESGLGDTEKKLDNTIKSLSGDYVTLKTNQSISGTKTFTALPRSAKNPTHQDELVRLGYLQSGQAGMILTGNWTFKGEWKNDVIYTNTKNKPVGLLICGVKYTNTLSYLYVINGNSKIRMLNVQRNGNADSAALIAFFILNPGWSWVVEGPVYKSNYSEFS